MPKVNKIILRAVSVLLCLVFCSFSLLSGIFARFVKTTEAEVGIAYKNWGITVTPGRTNASSSYTDSNGNMVVETTSSINGSDKIVAPGTSGNLLYLHVKGDAEVPFELNFDGSIEIGYGFWSVERMIDEKDYIIRKLKAQNSTWDDTQAENEYYRLLGLKKSVQIYDEVGREIEYLPIQIKLRRYDLDSNDNFNKTSAPTPHKLCVVRLAPDAPSDVTVSENDDETPNGNTQYRWCFYGQSRMATCAALERKVNEKVHTDTDGNVDNYWNHYFHVNRDYAANASVNSVYAVEWSWLYHYDTEEEYLAKKEAGQDTNRYLDKSHAEPGQETGPFKAVGDYQTADLDSQIAAAVAKCPELFNITLNFSVSVEQTVGVDVYNTFLENGVSKMKFGSYPQSDVVDETLKSTLNAKAGSLTDDNNNWAEYDNYDGKMWYTDISLDDGNKYRGVYIEEVRNGEQDTNGYYLDSVYWFKYEPIVWRILETDLSDRKALLLCETIIDSQPYQSGNVSSGLYKNNYEYSTIRAWLNETFYKTAFDKLQKQFILTTEVSNNPETTTDPNNPYVCGDTNDKIFLLSHQECSEYFPGETTNSERCRKPTAYAFSQGAAKATDNADAIYIGYGYWWLRSPYNKDNTGVYVVWHSSKITNDKVTCSENGVVPALWIKL